MLIPSIAVTLLTVVKSGRLAKWIDYMATDNDFSVREKLKRFGRGLRVPRGLPVHHHHDMSTNIEAGES